MQCLKFSLKLNRVVRYQQLLYRVSHKKGIDKKLLFRGAQGFNLQFLNLLGFSISVSLFGVSFKEFGRI